MNIIYTTLYIHVKANDLFYLTKQSPNIILPCNPYIQLMNYYAFFPIKSEISEYFTLTAHFGCRVSRALELPALAAGIRL